MTTLNPLPTTSGAVTVGGVGAQPGSVARGLWRLAESYDGSPVEIPVAVLNGAADGPVVWIQGAVHGDEYVGIGAIHRLIRNLDVDRLAGAVVAVPIVNVLALRAGSRAAPQDGLDMNRAYPGVPLDHAMHLFSHTEWVVHGLFEEIRRHAAAMLDLHDGGWMGRMSAYVQYFATRPDIDARARLLAEASGMDIVWETPAGFVEKKAPGSVGTATAALGIPTLTLEVGGEGRRPEHDVNRMYLAITNILKCLGMVQGDIEQHGREAKRFVRAGHWLRPRRGGIYVPHAQPGNAVAKGDLVAEVLDAFGELREELRAPVDGIIIGMRTYGVIASGQYGGNVAAVETLETT
jgi:uncharacterized protein